MYKTVLKVLALFSFLFIGGCFGEVDKKEYNQEKQKIVTKISDGKMRPDTEIAVQFYEKQIDAKNIGKGADSSAFVFAPDINGKAYWKDERTLVFKPKKEMTRKEKYSGVINLSKIFGFETEPQKVGLSFESSGNEVVDFDGYFEPQNQDKNSTKYIFTGFIEFSQKQKAADLKNGIKLKSGFFGSKKLFINKSSDTLFTFKSEPIDRGGFAKNFSFKVNKKKMFLEREFEKKFRLSPLGKLEFDRVEEDSDGEKTRLKVLFHERMDQNTDYKDFIKIEPKMDVSVKVEDRAVILTGEFQKGMKYSLSIFGGIKSAYGSIMDKLHTENVEITIGDVKPKAQFSNDGVFLTSAKDKKLCIKTINLERVYVEITKVLEDDIISFVEENGVNYVNNEEYSYGFKRVGEVVATSIVNIGKTKNKWVQTELDLSPIIKKNSHGLYIVKLNFTEKEMLSYPADWEDWQISDYVYSNGSIKKHLIFSDLGITMKKDTAKSHIFVNNIVTTEPVKGAVVLAKTKDNQVIDGGSTDSNGMCEIEKSGDYIEVRYKDQYSVMKLSESELSYSVFDIDGVDSEKGLKSFIYTDRGVYRPGEKINLTAIVRNESGAFPDNHPVTLKMYNPKGNLVYERVNKSAKDGFYGFDVQTLPTDFTGEWKAELNVAGAKFVKSIKVEEIVPYTLKVNIECANNTLSTSDRVVNFDVESKYLFGMPSAGLSNLTDVSLNPVEKKFSSFKDFIFSNNSIEFSEISSGRFEEKLDESGRASYSWEIPEYGAVPSALELNIKTKVIEKSGRPVPWSMKIPVKVYEKYSGIKQLENSEFSNGTNLKFTVVSVDEAGKISSGDTLEYRIYRTKNYWWWEYDSEAQFRKNYKSDKSLELVTSGTITSGAVPSYINYTINDYGEMLIELENKSSGHIASQFFGAHWWGGSGGSGKSADITTIKCDKEKYNPGDTAKISVKTPAKGRALITVEKNGVIISKKWETLHSTTTEFKLPITEKMVPNCYFSVSLYQPFEETKNDLPIRLYAVTPVTVEKADTNLAFNVKCAQEIRPNSKFDIEIETTDKKEAQFTVAIVDEGLLSITNFETPDPKKQFFSKERMVSRSFDIYSEIIGLTWGIVNKTVSIGGDGYNLNKEVVSKAKRFDPVVLYEAPFSTDKNGKKRLSFVMPNYVGAVRVMVVGVRGNSYGSQQKEIKVKSPLMIMPSLPRVLGTNDSIEMPVTVFAMKQGVGNVSVNVSCSGSIALTGNSSQTLYFDGEEERDVYFNIRAFNKIGVGKIKVTARSENGEYAEKIVEIGVRPYNPSISKSIEKFIKPGESLKYTVPAEGVIGAAKFKVELSSRKNINIGSRLKWLIQYPYGCIEQTTSGVFPQLYLSSIFTLTEKEKNEIDKNINAGIERLRKFQTSSGGFSYWPGENEPSLWGTNYAGHFMIEAKARGYHVPEDMFNNWKKFQIEKSNKITQDFTDMCYRLYVMSLAKSPDISSMNLIKENYLQILSNTDRYLLASAYKIAGYDSVYKSIVSTAKPIVKRYSELSGNFGSDLRDKAIILEAMVLSKNFGQGSKMFDEIAESIASEEWYSTQTLGYSLISMGKFIEATSNGNTAINAAVYAGGSQFNGVSKGKMVSLPINKGYGKEMSIKNNSNAPLFANMVWEGIPVDSSIGDSSKNMAVFVEWLNEDGEVISPENLKQGESFWGHFRVTKPYSTVIDKCALVQILPSGWEIDNTRLSGENAPIWTSSLNLGREEYLDIRDDRIMWFFDMKSGEDKYDFIVKLNAVTAGEFQLSPTLCEAMYSDNFRATARGYRVNVYR